MKNICVWNVSQTIFCIWDFFVYIEVYVYINKKKIADQHTQAYCPVCICRNIKCIQEGPNYESESMRGYLQCGVILAL